MEICFYFPIEVNFPAIITIPQTFTERTKHFRLPFSRLLYRKRIVKEDHDFSFSFLFNCTLWLSMIFSSCYFPFPPPARRFPSRNLLLVLLDFSLPDQFMCTLVPTKLIKKTP